MLMFWESLAHHHSTGWCCNCHTETRFDWNHFFKGRLLCKDPKTSTLYYGKVDDPDHEETLPPLQMKQKMSVKMRATNQPKLLTSQLKAWCSDVHSKAPLVFVWPPSLILNNTSIKVLVQLHPTNIANSEQVVSALGQTQEWQDLWSCHVLAVIQAHDCEITDRCKKKLAQKKASQKQVKQEKDQAKFSKISNKVTERIQQKVLSQYVWQWERLRLVGKDPQWK